MNCFLIKVRLSKWSRAWNCALVATSDLTILLKYSTRTSRLTKERSDIRMSSLNLFQRSPWIYVFPFTCAIFHFIRSSWSAQHGSTSKASLTECLLRSRTSVTTRTKRPHCITLKWIFEATLFFIFLIGFLLTRLSILQFTSLC